MRFLCLGYINVSQWDAVSQSEQEALMEECFQYDDELRRNGHWADGSAALQSASAAKTLRSKDGHLFVTDGPFAETKEQLDGFFLISARDQGAAARGGRIQLPARRSRDERRERGDDGLGSRCIRGHDRNRRWHLHARAGRA